MTDCTIPVVDIGPFDDGDVMARKRITSEVDWACRHIGFLVIANHGVRRRLIDDAFAVSCTANGRWHP